MQRKISGRGYYHIWLGEFGVYSNKSKDAYAIHNVYGSDITEVSNDPKLWSCLQGNGRTSRVFWVGSSDLHYMVTKTSSSFSGHASSYADYQRLLEEARAMRTNARE